MRLRIYRRYEDQLPNDWRSVREQTTDHIVQDYEHARQRLAEVLTQFNPCQSTQVGLNFTLWDD